MLLELRIENLLLIDRAELRPGDGLNAITGETGAGKTVLAHALDLLLGGKPRSGIVRPGADGGLRRGRVRAARRALRIPSWRTCVSASAAPTGEVVLARRVSAEGRTRAYVQGRSATAADLRELGGRLLAFFGQHEHRKLTVAARSSTCSTGSAGASTWRCATGRRRRTRGCARRRASSRSCAVARARATATSTCSRFEIEEIEAARADAEDEEPALLAERERLRQVDGLRAAAAAGERGDRVRGRRGARRRCWRRPSGWRTPWTGPTPSWTPSPSGCARCGSRRRTSAGSCAATSRASTPIRSGCKQVEERLDAYDRLKRKHGGTVAAVLEHAERCRAERDRLENAEVVLEQAEAALAERRGRAGGAWPASSRGRAAEGRAQAGEAGARRAGRAGDGGRLVRGGARATRRDRPGRRRAGGVHARARTPACPRRRCARARRAASCRG